MPNAHDLPRVVEIASVSECMAKGPSDWIASWAHNELGFFDRVDLSESVVPSAERGLFHIYAYELLAQRFDRGVGAAWTVPSLNSTGPGDDFQPLGFDVVSKSVSDFFECSPLSCNRRAKTFETNEYCLFDALADAVAAAVALSKEQCEPGPYYVARVSRRRAGG